MIWYLLYPLRGTTEAPALSPSNPVRVAFTRYGNYVARHVILALLISGVVATILIYPIPYLFTDDFTNGASNLPHHVWTVAQPLSRDAPVLPDIIMRSIWVHGDYMKALDNDLLSYALELQDELLGPTERFTPAASRGLFTPGDQDWPMPTKNRDAIHIVNGLTNQSWFFHSPLLYWQCSRQKILADTDLITTVNERKTQSTSANVTLRHSIVFSGKRFAERRLLAADALVITLLYLRDSPVGRQWEHNAPLLTRKAQDQWDIYPPDGSIESSQLYEFQFRPMSLYDMICFALAYGLMGIYFLASLSKLRAIKSKAGLTAMVITQIFLSILSSLTVCAVFDVDLSRIPRAAYPLVILAISLENMFRIIYAVILMPAENSSSSRVGSAFGQTAHIALASTVQNVAILAGLSTIVSPGVAGFCVFAATATLFDYFYLSTFFLSVLSVDVRRTELEDELSKISKLRHRHTYGQLKERPWWISNFLKGRVSLSTRIAGTIVMIGFVIIAQWHFFADVGAWEPTKRLLGASTWQSQIAEEASPQLEEVHQARSPGSWLRLQDHETAREVINAIKPSAFSYTAKVYDPLVFVLKNSNRTPPQKKKNFLPAVYDFVDHQLAEFVISIVLVCACLRLLASYLLLADEETRDNFSDSGENSSLSVKTLSGGHALDVVMIAASADGRVVSAGLDRTIRVWDVRSDSASYELPGTKLLDGREMFPILGIIVDVESQWLAILSMTQIRLWNLAEYAWREPVPLESGNHNPEVLCFHPRSTQNIPRLVIVRKDGTLTDVSLVGDDRRRGTTVCEGQLLTARALIYKGEPLSRSTCIFYSANSCRTRVDDYTGDPDLVALTKRRTLHIEGDGDGLVPLSPFPLFLIGSVSSVYLVSASDGVVLHVFATEPMVPRSIQCEYPDNRNNLSPSGVGFSTLTLGYVGAETEDCIVTSHRPREGSEAIAACAASGGAGGGWCTWKEAIETKKRIKDPGTWEIVKGRSVIGVRQEANPSRNTKRGDYRRRSAARENLGAPTRWQAWTAATDEHFEADEVRPLHNDGHDSEEFLVVPGLGPKVKIGLRSVAFSVGNTVKVISAGGPERFKGGDDDAGAESLLATDSRRGRYAGSMRGRH
ncbi:Sterol regulatory element-binding protein cleavage-activating protein [Cordyceps militaris CM01]|uniref:Sterol regulatory element-binding protein cleavage-activating protein n=1 Tax=Cordyceps militaris (strain CM01) TaxID=983644 RepID=G3JD76_CORMM|nr:Sterol regulatory element-binding protein cleavage-activating protein [Cordyceps militaris CM01]EGX92551.1 Sterol regulatory element-binding protein cleavage-activating protein [Cordyceps militaris CM01]